MGTWHQKGSPRLEDLVDAFWWVGLYYTLTLTGSEGKDCFILSVLVCFAIWTFISMIRMCYVYNTGIELSHQVCGSPNNTRVMDLCKNILIRRHT